MKQPNTKQPLSQQPQSRNSRTSSASPSMSTGGGSRPKHHRSLTSKLQSSDKLTSPTNTLTAPSRTHTKEIRSKSVSIDRTRPQPRRHLPEDDRRPSAPPIMVDEKPRLSIADRFMSSNYEGTSVKTTSAASSAQQDTSTTSPSASTISNSITVLSSTSDTNHSSGSNKRLSVADRFSNQRSPNMTHRLTLSPKNSLNEDLHHYKRSLSPASNFSGSDRVIRDTARPSLNQKIRSSSFDTAAVTASAEQPRRLTIADTFMKRSSALLPPTVPEPSRVRAASFAGALVLDVTNTNRKNSHVHPLDSRPSKSSLFDTSTRSYLQSPELSVSPSSASSSLINNHIETKNANGNITWGSQDTLVHQQPTTPPVGRKKPIYAQFMESEKDTTLSTPLTFNNYSLDIDEKPTSAQDDYRFSGYGQYTDIEESRYRHPSHYLIPQKHEWCDEHSAYDPDTYPYYDEEYDDEEKGSYYDTTTSRSYSQNGSTTKLHDHHQSIKRPDSNNSNNSSKGHGFWIGCCFISCGQRPSRQSIIEQQQLKRQKKKREKELQERKDCKKREEQRSNKKLNSSGRWCHGCCCLGRKGWVFCIFLCLIFGAVITYFLWPRTPLIRIEGASLSLPAKISETRQGLVGNVAFKSEWLVNVTVDNRQNHIPTRLSRIQVLAKDALTGLIIGKGLPDDMQQQQQQQQIELLQSITLPANTISTIQLPIHLNYQARDSTDPTFVDIVKACAPNDPILYHPSDEGNINQQQQQQQQQRESLPLHFWITLHFYGLDWLGYKPTVIATPATGGFACPLS